MRSLIGLSAVGATLALPYAALAGYRPIDAQNLADLGSSYPLPSLHLRIGWIF
jgi:hypothetical protein